MVAFVILVFYHKLLPMVSLSMALPSEQSPCLSNTKWTMDPLFTVFSINKLVLIIGLLLFAFLVAACCLVAACYLVAKSKRMKHFAPAESRIEPLTL